MTLPKVPAASQRLFSRKRTKREVLNPAPVVVEPAAAAAAAPPVSAESAAVDKPSISGTIKTEIPPVVTDVKPEVPASSVAPPGFRRR